MYRIYDHKNKFAIRPRVERLQSVVERNIYQYYQDVWSEGDMDCLKMIMSPNATCRDCVWFGEDARGLDKL